MAETVEPPIQKAVVETAVPIVGDITQQALATAGDKIPPEQQALATSIVNEAVQQTIAINAGASLAGGVVTALSSTAINSLLAKVPEALRGVLGAVINTAVQLTTASLLSRLKKSTPVTNGNAPTNKATTKTQQPPANGKPVNETGVGGTKETASTPSNNTDAPHVIAEILIKYDKNKTIRIINFTSLHVCEKYGDHLQVEFVLPARNMQEQEEYITLAQAREYLGQTAEIKIGKPKKDHQTKYKMEIDEDVPEKEKPREFSFIITDIYPQFYEGYQVGITIKGYSPTYILKQAVNFETYNDTLDNIINAVSAPCHEGKGTTKVVIAKSNIKDKIYACRFGEPAFHFMRRLANTYAQYFYYNGKQFVFGELENTKKTTLTYGSGGMGYCNNLYMSAQVHAAHTSMFYYNDETDAPLTAQAPEQENKLGKMGWFGTQALAKAHELCTGISNVPSSISIPDQPILEKNTNYYAASSAAQMYNLSFQSSDYTLSLCQQVTIQYPHEPGKDLEQSDIRLTEIHHHVMGNNGIYSNYVHSIPAGLSYPPSLPSYMPITYPVLAKVSNNKGSHGKVEVEFIGWKSQKGETCKSNWIRVASPNAGAKDRGFKFIPEIGDQVLVNFYEGVPEKAYVQCSMYSAPATTGIVGDNDIKSIITKSGCTIQFDDSKGSITIKDPKNAMIIMKGNGTLEISAPEKISISSKIVDIKGDDNVNVNGKKITMIAEERLGLTSRQELAIKSVTKTTVESATVTKLYAPNIELFADANVKIAGTITDIQGITTNIKGTGVLHLNES